MRKIVEESLEKAEETGRLGYYKYIDKEGNELEAPYPLP